MNFAASVRSILDHLENAQWWPADILRRHQFAMLQPLVSHAYRTVPWYRRPFEAIGLSPEQIADETAWRSVPLLTRTDVQDAQESLHSTAVPPEHGRVSRIWTGGSTATPVMVLTTEVTGRFWMANTIREHCWQHRDLNQKMAVIRYVPRGGAEPPSGVTVDSWDRATAGRFKTGPCAVLNIKSTTRQQADWLEREQPTYLQTYPSVVFELAELSFAEGRRLQNLKQVCTFGEVVEPMVREACRRAWDVELLDSYSTNEVGHVAIECAEHGYHLQAEHLLIEVLDERGQQCAPGATGRVVITDLFNFAMPLLRYEIGDYAEVGGPCQCGRNLPTLRRILGRQRNMFLLPNGQKRWPAMEVDPAAAFEARLPVRQFQAIQRSRRDIELKLVAARALAPDEEAAVRGMLVGAVGDGFSIRFNYVDHIPRGPSGKFEDFRCEIDPG